MPKLCFERLIYDDRSTNQADTVPAIDPADQVFVAAREVLVAIWTASGVDAERVHRALIHLLEAVVDAGQPGGADP